MRDKSAHAQHVDLLDFVGRRRCAERADLAARHRGAGLAGLGGRVEHGVHGIHVEEVRERVAAQPQANGFEAHHLIGGNIAQVHISSQQLDEPHLLGFLGCFPQDFLRVTASNNA